MKKHFFFISYQYNCISKIGLGNVGYQSDGLLNYYELVAHLQEKLAKTLLVDKDTINVVVLNIMPLSEEEHKALWKRK